MFTIPERQIYQFTDGETIKSVDPIEAYLSMLDCGLDWESELESLAAGNHKNMRAIVDAARKAFGVSVFESKDDGTCEGFTDAQVIALMEDFATYLSGLKKTPDPSQTSLVCLVE